MKKPFLGETSFLSDAVGIEGGEISSLPVDASTGRYLITLPEGERSFAKLKKICKTKLGLRIANTNDFKGQDYTENDIADADVLIFQDLGIALLGPEDNEKSADYQQYDTISHVRNEQVVYTSAIPNSLTATWGIEQTNTPLSNFTGNGVKVAVLDTGIDLTHPDFVGRSITTNSFVPDESIQDVHGHGTHCIGTACGNINTTGVRYGVASGANIFVGKVLDKTGHGAQAWILAGMQWAAQNGCKVISMSLGSPAKPNFDPAYERAAKFVMGKGGVVVAAAGNDSDRLSGIIAPVGSPANCPSILAVAALDANILAGNVGFNVANFSCGTVFLHPSAKVDIAAPGVNVYSTWPMPTRYRAISGTSMATPHVAGLIALLFEAFPTFTPTQIIVKLFSGAKSLLLPNTDVGIGLATAF